MKNFISGIITIMLTAGVLYYIEHNTDMHRIISTLESVSIQTLILNFEAGALIFVFVGVAIGHFRDVGNLIAGIFSPNAHNHDERGGLSWNDIFICIFALASSILMLGYQRLVETP